MDIIVNAAWNNQSLLAIVFMYYFQRWRIWLESKNYKPMLRKEKKRSGQLQVHKFYLHSAYSLE